VRIFFLIFLFLPTISFASGKCHGKFINPVSQVAWKTLFPLYISGEKVADPNKDRATTKPEYKSTLCKCGLKIGIPVAFWEPFRLADVTRKKFCMVNLGGHTLPIKTKRGAGDVANKSTVGLGTSQQSASYYIHWYIFPALKMLELITGFSCGEDSLDFDVAYMSELDPAFHDDEISIWMHPESALFANPISEVACAADCIKSSIATPANEMFWCSGCRGGIYPISGNLAFHSSGSDASSHIVEKLIFKLHRTGVLQGTMGKRALCHKYPQLFWKKNQYKLQMTYPSINKSNEFAANPIGKTSFIWGMNKELNPIDGDFGYLVWRRVECCVTPL
jgi:conjugal transfer pilus assembly protein TraU